ncbi:N-acetyltransferase family protein [Hypericibacter sp.]|uniref:GNAT family N-acetyltransferase n=1 Tax=Hypericibacter sp. TaxID=2705401 RepID=UPI003D6CF7F2
MIEVRPATPQDIPALGRLMAELLAHYGMAGPDAANIAKALAAQLPKVEFLLAFEGDDLEGFASFSLLFPGLGLDPQFYMKDLYTAVAARGRGVARALMRALARRARDRGCVRIDWTTDRDNLPARAAYKALGAAVLDERVYYRLDADAITRLADEM